MKTMMNTGTMELRTLYHRYITEGLVIAGLLHFAVFGCVQFLIRHYNIDDKIPPIVFDKPIDWIPIDFNRGTAIPKISIPKQTSFVNNTIPIPVPDKPEEETETNIENNNPDPVFGSENGDPNVTTPVISENVVIGEGEESTPPIFRPVEKHPVAISNPSPKYPELARKAGVEGTVFIKMWVTKEGKVKTAEIVKSTSNLFDQAAIDAALLWTFTPAIMNNGPVSVWVTVPFKFRLSVR